MASTGRETHELRTGDMKLHEYEDACRKRLSAEDSPPILGLVPLSQVDCDRIGALVTGEVSRAQFLPSYQVVLSLLRRHPAAVALWLARVAGAAYDSGAFWDEFGRKVGVSVGVNQRRDFAGAFRRACRDQMANFVAPAILSRAYVDEFLFQAGLPLCHCEIYARLLRAVTDDFGLPEPEDMEAVEDLREALLTRSELGVRGTLQRALEGPAGMHILQATLRVVRDEGFHTINPQMGERLREAFATRAARAGERALRWPFLRLAESVCALETVGPPQDPGLVGGFGLCWTFNGVPFRVAVGDECPFPITDEDRVVVELRGLRDGRTLRREFVFGHGAGAPFLLFSATTRRQWRCASLDGECQIPCGDYWLLHPTDLEVTPTVQLVEWPDGHRVVNLIRVRPGAEVTLTDETEKTVYQFRPAQSPYLELLGETILTDEGQRIHFGWTELPVVWVPASEIGEAEGWVLRATFDQVVGEWKLTPDAKGACGGLMPCKCTEARFLKQLTPALYEARFEVLRRNRRQASQSFWVWHGVSEVDSQCFRFAAPPANLLPARCAGFDLGPERFRHEEDDLRQHTLAFDISGTVASFHWSQPGIFVESFSRVPGRSIQPRSHSLNETVSASPECARWLRVWHVPAGNAELLVNGDVVQRAEDRASRPFFELSLAHLATLHPSGGTVVLRRAGIETRVARFTRPLIPEKFAFSCGSGYQTLFCLFADAADWVRPRVTDLVSGQTAEYAGKRFGTSGHCLFHTDGLPVVECANINANGNSDARGYRVTLDVPQGGWPPGVWLLELELRRDETSEWQPLTDEQGGRLPLLLLVPPTTAPSSYRAKCLWWAFGRGLAAEALTDKLPSSAGSERELCEMLRIVSKWLSLGFNEMAWARLRFLEMLFSELAKQASWLLESGASTFAERLLETVASERCRNPARSLFAVVPELFALPAEKFCGLSNGEPIPASLLWCAALSTAPRVADAFQDLIIRVQFLHGGRVPGLFFVLQHFKNFVATVQQQGPSGKLCDFARFDYQRYFGSTIGPLRDLSVATDYSEADALTRDHALWALAQLSQRRQRGEGGSLAEANQVFSGANDLRTWLVSHVQSRHLLPEGIRPSPWLDVDLADDALVVACSQFASVFALTARAAGAGWLSFGGALGFLSQRHGRGAVAKAVTTLVCQAPELLGFHLMFWELMIRTCPHD